LLGGSDKDAKPEQPAAPPYQYAAFIQPQYTPEHPLGGEPNVTIDPNTGLITGIPNTLGQFVVSVCVAEYRNGKLLGKMFRDFQFNVVNCQRTVVTKVVADSIALEGKIKKFIIRKCENAPLTIQNKSFERANINDFYWEFNISGVQKRFADWNPAIPFRDTGVYLGKLVLNPDLECRDSAYIRIEIGGRLDPSFTIKYDTCIAGSIKFQSNGLKEMVWDYGDNSNDKGILSTTHIYESPGIKKVNLSLTDNIGCKRDTSISFVWQPAPPILIVEPDKFTGCAPVPVTFINRSNPIDSTYKISWDFGEGHFSKTISPQHLYEIADTYSIKLQIVSPLGCKKEAIFKDWIKIRNTPKADFDFISKEVTILNPSVAFNNKSSSDVTLWRWDFGIKGFSSRPNPSYSFKDTGTHTVTLRVINNEECSDTISHDVRVEPFVMFNFPNAFTPNNDAKNDEFKGKGFFDGLKSYQMTIRSRWGDVVFQTNNPDDGWNGLKGNIGEQVPDGVYMYEVIYVTPKNERVSKRDFVTVIR
jgi:gliding motility-associated-like protein